MNTDFESFFRNKVESMLITASWVEHVQRMLNLKAVSQVWGVKPEWYIWLNHAPGVYALVLEDAETVETADRALCAGQFAVKCYPYIDSSIFKTFSPQEREMLTGELFDETHTPRLETRECIPETFFVVGSISIMLDDAETLVFLTVDSLDSLRLRSASAFDDPPTATAGNSEGSIIRKVPGWQICYPLFDRLTGLYAFYSRHPPVFIGATRSPGFEYLVGAEQQMECRPCMATRQLAACLLFAKSSRDGSLADSIWQGFIDPYDEVILRRRLPPSFNGQLNVDNPTEVPINPLWWQLARTELKSQLASTCGCHDR